MVRTNRAIGTHQAIVLGIGFVGSLSSGMTRADDSLPLRAALDPVDVQTIDLQGPSITVPVAQVVAIKLLRLTLTRAELQSIIARHEKISGHATGGQLEENTVTARVELLPMRDMAHEVWGGIAAPLWAVLHPTQAWRILLPIPPE
jgi:hypothetical protein